VIDRVTSTYEHAQGGSMELVLTRNTRPKARLLKNRKLCFNPEHLYMGTNSSNQLDAVRDGLNYNANKTHCLRGHEFTPENTAIYGGARNCRACGKLKDKARIR